MKLKNAREIEEGTVLKEGTSKKNKTGNWKTFEPVVDFDKCIHCMKCVMYCPDICIFQKNGKRGKNDLSMCKGCGICAQVCPANAIKMVKRK